MAKAVAMIKVDVRSGSSLLTALEAGQGQRSTYGELGYSVYTDDAQRHISYVLLNWESLRSLEQFMDSENSRKILMSWPVQEIFEVILLRDMVEEYGALSQRSPDLA
jgi:quinol monooxygenase YgiN